MEVDYKCVMLLNVSVDLLCQLFISSNAYAVFHDAPNWLNK